MKYIITVNGISYEVEVATVDGATPAAFTAPVAAAAPITTAPITAAAPPVAAPVAAPVVTAAPATATAGAGERVNAPMPGVILNIVAEVGTMVSQGQAVVTLEAMKMENEIASPKAGRVSSINVSKGESVKSGQLLFVIE